MVSWKILHLNSRGHIFFRSNSKLGDLALVGNLEKSTIHPYKYWNHERLLYN